MGTIAYVGNTNNLELTGLKDDITNAYINDATVTVTVKDSGGLELPGIAWPLTMDYVPASNGNYRTYLTHTLGLLSGKKYTAFVDADGSDSSTERFGHWEFTFTANKRVS